jgi:hypothetical protein
MRRFSLLALILLATAASAYAQFTFTSIDFPGGTLTTARGIPSRGVPIGCRSSLAVSAVSSFVPV